MAALPLFPLMFQVCERTKPDHECNQHERAPAGKGGVERESIRCAPNRNERTNPPDRQCDERNDGAPTDKIKEFRNK